MPPRLRVGPLLPKLRGQLAEFLHEGSLARLSLLSSPTCVGLRYGSRPSGRVAFLGTSGDLPRPEGLSTNWRADGNQRVPTRVLAASHGISTVVSIAYATWPRLRSRLTLGGRTCPKNP